MQSDKGGDLDTGRHKMPHGLHQKDKDCHDPKLKWRPGFSASEKTNHTAPLIEHLAVV